MGLFDDIIKKNGNPQGSGGFSGDGTTGSVQPATPQIVIQKTSEETVFGMDKMEEKKYTPPVVNPEIHAETDTSSILVGTASEKPLTGATTPATPFISTQPVDESALTLDEDTASPLIIPSKPAVAQNPPPVQMPAPTPVQNPPLIDPLATSTPIPNHNLLETVLGETPSDNNLLVSLGKEEKQATTIETPPVAEEAPLEKESFATPRDFIQKSLESIALMMKNIDERHSAKITEAEGYKAEKLRFTDLEKNAYHEASIMDKERDHAVHMKKILEAELARDEANRSGKGETTHVESTLSEIGSVHPVSHAKHSHRKHENHDSDTVLMAS